MAREYGVPVPNADSLLQTAHYSPYLNIYAYPEELDYLDIRPLPPKFKAFPHFIRLSEKAEEDFTRIPEEFLSRKLGKLVYVSMGSMGSVCRILMSRLVEMLSKSPNRFIFSLGPSYDHLTGKEAGPLPANIWAAKFVPQIEVLQLVDLVVTHGGNNTLLESLYLGKPMIVCPLFAEQPEVRVLFSSIFKICYFFNYQKLFPRTPNASKRLASDCASTPTRVNQRRCCLKLSSF